MKIRIIKHSSSLPPYYLKKIKDVSYFTFRRLKFDGKGNINLVLLSPKSIKKLKKKFFNINKPTDVITFNYMDNFSKTQEVICEIFICPQQVKKNSRIYKEKFINELLRVTIHGILHFFGYKDKMRIFQLQENILKKYLSKRL